jgi:hypothetical protein
MHKKNLKGFPSTSMFVICGVDQTVGKLKGVGYLVWNSHNWTLTMF